MTRPGYRARRQGSLVATSDLHIRGGRWGLKAWPQAGGKTTKLLGGGTVRYSSNCEASAWESSTRYFLLLFAVPPAGCCSKLLRTLQASHLTPSRDSIPIRWLLLARLPQSANIRLPSTRPTQRTSYQHSMLPLPSSPRLLSCK